MTEEIRERASGAGGVWTWTAIDADSKLCISYLVGARDGFCAELLMRDLESRLGDRTQLTTDSLNVYMRAVDIAFKGEVDYAMLHKVYAGASCDASTVFQERVACCGPNLPQRARGSKRAEGARACG